MHVERLTFMKYEHGGDLTYIELHSNIYSCRRQLIKGEEGDGEKDGTVIDLPF